MENGMKKKFKQTGVAFLLSLSLMAGDALPFVSPVVAYAGTPQSMTIKTDETMNASQSQEVTIPGLVKVVGVTTDNGSVTFTQNGDKVTVKPTGGSPSRQVWISDKYSKAVSTTETNRTNSGFSSSKPYSDGSGYSGTMYPTGSSYLQSGSFTSADSKFIDAYTSSSYNSGGYSGTLSQYLYSGEYVADETKYVTSQTSSYYNSGGFVGNLSSYVYSGSYTPSDTQYVTGQYSSYYSSGGYSGSLSSYVYSGSYTSADTKYVTGQYSSYYNSGGYSGSLSQYQSGGSYQPSESKYVSNYVGKTQTGYCDTRMGTNWAGCNPKPSAPGSVSYSSGGYSGSLSYDDYQYWQGAEYSSGNGHRRFDYTRTWYYSGTVTKPGYDTRTYAYQGYVTRPASDTRVYRYQGYVTRPESDTRQYRYQGNVTKKGYDTRQYRYRGTVYRPESDTRVYAQDYNGTAYKGGYDNYYQYDVVITYWTDNVPPTIDVSYDNSKPTNVGKIIVTTTDNDSGVSKIQLPDGSWVKGDHTELEVTKNGEYTFVAEDEAGNQVTGKVTVSNIDREAPNAPSIVLNESWVNHNVTAVITHNGDNGSAGVKQMEYKLSGATSTEWTPYTKPVELSEDGLTTFTARVVDNAGNNSATASKQAKIDKVKPIIVVAQDISGLTNTDVQLTANATDNLSGVKRIQLPNGNWMSGSVATYRVGDNGTYRFTAEDNAGNTEVFEKTVTNIKKNVLITPIREVVLDLTADDLYSGVTDMRFKNETGSWSGWMPYKPKADWTVTPVDGLKHVWVQYKDKVGNESEAIEDIIILDMTKPIVESMVINDNDTYTKTPTVKLKLKASDNLSGLDKVMISNDNKNWTTTDYQTEIDWVLASEEGNRTVYVKVVDKAGNESIVKTDSIFLDTVKPLASILINNGDSFTPVRDVNLTLTYSDTPGSGVESVKVIEDDREYTLPKPTPNSPITIPWTLGFGVSKTVSIVVVDKAGNVSNIASDSIIVDKLTIKDFTLEHVVNPLEFNKKHPFTPQVWAFEPQPMIAGGDITFSIDVKTAVDQSVIKDKVDYKVEIIGDGGYHKAFIGAMSKSGDHYTQTITIPKDTPSGAKVYAIATAERQLLIKPYEVQTVYFPGGTDPSQKAQIGIVDGNIYEAIRFNETK